MDDEYIKVEVPDMNDSTSRIVINKEVFYLRFTYNDTFDYWKLSVYDSLMGKIIEGIKIVPNFCLNLFCPTRKLPKVAFVVFTQQDRIGKDDFKNGKAQFLYAPL